MVDFKVNNPLSTHIVFKNHLLFHDGGVLLLKQTKIANKLELEIQRTFFCREPTCFNCLQNAAFLPFYYVQLF